jgi:ArsR family transcriptional regulator, arsenate/arsenite/antimonite-responsive transcriptional repressor
MQTIAMIAAGCAPLSEEPLAAADAEQLAAALKVIADPARLRLLSLIQAQEGGEACSCNLQQPLGLSQPTVSHHLKVLVDSGLLSREQRGRWAYFRVVPDQLHSLRDLLA